MVSNFGACVRAKRAGRHTGSKTVEGTHTGLENKAPSTQRSRTWAAEGQAGQPEPKCVGKRKGWMTQEVMIGCHRASPATKRMCFVRSS
jgi:hypothetical protein